MKLVKPYIVLLCLLTFNWNVAQDLAFNNAMDDSYDAAYALAYKGEHGRAKAILISFLDKQPDHEDARTLLANTYSWDRQYEAARREYNTVTSNNRNHKAAWIGAIKNELYAKNEGIALGLAYKALSYLDKENEIERLKSISQNRLESKEYKENGWYNVESVITSKSKKSPKNTKQKIVEGEDKEGKDEKEQITSSIAKTAAEKDVFNNRIDIRNAVTVFDQRYDPMIYTSISYRRQTMAGALIPRLNYSNRLGKNGIQYDLDFYPKFSKRFYAYLNYGYSNSSIYPEHKFGGDLYVNLPGAIEFSAGGRHITFESGDVNVLTNSLGHYRGNYYFSLRSYITPKPDNLTRFAGNLLVRKYLKDAENFFGVNLGMGYSPELRQIISGDELLAETLLYVESQRLSLEYQFTGKNNQNAYRANLGATRQELAFAAGKFFYGISAGITYQVKF
ncbi:YaiO family outer membrane beta-barrel protein [Cytophaga sp. FL35]|uniref:YaiO family outer membrane beta-barrel protein n=1 Tax=Cytophaga sp. FL35 TaxID=1904456 RepID=UPI001653B15A|nr:YaiO family outer membrane beta-barrel protein [Cytophaga sp. FL35]MBC7000036.1 YaiO family outer membrane beta-barrel protein [Cytophaga sp. FL35]